MAFIDKSIRAYCEDNEIATKKYGIDVSDKLKARLADLRAVKNVGEVWVGDPKFFKENDLFCVSLNLNNGYTLKFCPNHTKNPINEFGEINWSMVTRIKILSIESNA